MLIAHRYLIMELIGRGGTGMVYRAYDRLTGQEVALKRVRNVSDAASLIEQSFSEEERLMLAHEFKIMASLHHPNIIEVLDYGFDADQPFFTMTLLHNPPTVVECAQSLDFNKQILLFGQLLSAIQYLHRRGILHRDLKPANVLVDNDQLRVLDFGLALDHDPQTAENAGTTLYLAPEVLRGRPPSVASDMYALGVILYEMLTGQHPFQALTRDMNSFVDRLSSAQLDVTPIPAPVQNVVKGLLEKRPENRYKDIRDLMFTLSISLGWSIGQAQIGSQESSLSASLFVGRKKELATLSDALDAAIGGRGSMWLIGGVSGVGKSRLLDELRIRALTQGVTVLRGQEQKGHSLAYQVWREPSTGLALTTAMNDLEAAILKELVPDLDRLLDQPVAPAPPLPDRTEHQHRLFTVLNRLFLRQTQPILLVLEDLQWTVEGLKPLQQLIRQIENRPLLILGSYRSEETPDLPGELPQAKVLELERFSTAEAAELTKAILGELPNSHQITALVDTASEGNAFFVLEAIRALDHAAGGLNKVATVQRPSDLFIDGINSALSRRLEWIPSWARPILELAAIIGRTLDLKVLRASMNNPQNLDAWLAICSDTAVLEIRDTRWVFAHDKIREAILGALPADREEALHRRVATAIEATYPNDSTYAKILIGHWLKVPDVPEKLLFYAPIVGEQMRRSSRVQEAIALYEMVIPLIPAEDTRRQTEFIGTLGYWYFETDNPERAQTLLEEALLLAKHDGNQRLQIENLTRLSQLKVQNGHYGQALEPANRAVELAAAFGDPKIEALALFIRADCLLRSEDFGLAEKDLRASLDLAEQIGDQEQTYADLGALAQVMAYTSQVETSLELYTQCIVYYQESLNDDRLHTTITALTIVLGREGRYSEALSYGLQNLAISRSSRPSWDQVCDLTLIGYIHLGLHDHQNARRYFDEALKTGVDLDVPSLMLNILSGFAQVEYHNGHQTLAVEILAMALHHADINSDVRTAASLLLNSYQSDMPPEQFIAAFEQGKIRELNATAALFLGR